MNSTQDVFDLEITGAAIQFDLIIDPPSQQTKVTLEQCHNFVKPNIADCDTPNGPSDNTWGSGNANAKNARVSEGDSQNYRVIIQDLLASDDENDIYTLVIEQDYTKGGKMAQDFWTGPGNMPTNVTTALYNEGIHPCVGTTGIQDEYCDPLDPNSYFEVHIPDMGAFIANGTQYDGGPDMPGLGPQDKILGNQTSFAEQEHLTNIPLDQLSPGMLLVGPINNTIFQPYMNYTGFSGSVDADSSVFATITFMTNETGDVVLFYGGHISDTKDYAAIGKQSAVDVSGSPYHNALEDSNVKNGCCGQQDMQLASAAVAELASLNLTKIVDNTNGGTAVPNDWILYANGSENNQDLDFGVPGGEKTFNDILPNIVYNLTEVANTTSAENAYAAGEWVCTEGDGITFDPQTNEIMLEEGVNATCTITNTAQAAKLRLVKILVNDDGGSSVLSDWYLAANTTDSDKTRDFNATAVKEPEFRNVFANINYTLSD
jgi:hypothetical protein